MARCETCGNDYDKAFEITAAGESHVFGRIQSSGWIGWRSASWHFQFRETKRKNICYSSSAINYKTTPN